MKSTFDRPRTRKATNTLSVKSCPSPSEFYVILLSSTNSRSSNPSRDPPVSQEFATNLLENLQSERQLLELKFHDKTTTRVSLAKFNFRIDVSIRDEESSIKPIPILILDLTLSNGKRITFRCPMAQFHQLRFTAARLLKEIQFLGTRQIITR